MVSIQNDDERNEKVKVFVDDQSISFKKRNTFEKTINLNQHFVQYFRLKTIRFILVSISSYILYYGYILQ